MVSSIEKNGNGNGNPAEHVFAAADDFHAQAKEVPAPPKYAGDPAVKASFNDAHPPVSISEDDAQTIQTCEERIFRLQQQLGRAREQALLVENQVLEQIARARTEWQTVLVTVGRKNGLTDIGTPDADYTYDAPSRTYRRTR